MKKWFFEIEARENGIKGIKNGSFMAEDIVFAENENEAIEKLDQQNDKAGYKVLRAYLIKHEILD